MSQLMMFIVRNDSFTLHFMIILTYYNILTLKCPHIQSQSVYFSNVSWGHAPRPLTISMLCMLIVLHTITHTVIHYKRASVHIHYTAILILCDGVTTQKQLQAPTSLHIQLNACTNKAFSSTSIRFNPYYDWHDLYL